MASHQETLQFLIEVSVRGADQIARLKAEMEGLSKHQRDLITQMRHEVNTGSAGGSGGYRGAAGPTVAPGTSSGSSTGIEGVRSRARPGSRMNPIVVVQESAAASGLGSLAAPDNANSGGNGANSPNGPGGNGIATPQPVSAPTPTSPTDQGAGRQIGRDMADEFASKIAPNLDRIAEQIEASKPRTVDTGGAARMLGRSRPEIREIVASGGVPGAYKQSGEWVLPEDEVARLAADMQAAGGGHGGGGGGGRIAVGGSAGGGGWRPNGGGGGGGSKIFWSPWSGMRSQGDSTPFTFGNIFKGDGGRGGAFGLPGFGSVGSLGGLGLEHWLLTSLGLGVSAGSAVGGAGLLATASLTKAAVGGGADALVNHVTLQNVKTLTGLTQQLNQAVAQYGRNSSQAQQAQQKLNAAMAQIGPAAASEEQVARNVDGLRQSFDAASQGAQSTSAAIMNQAVELAQDYVPLVTQAAQRNLSIINTGLKPLFTWLEGPQGMGIFRTLENSFAQGLPTSIHAVDMAIEDFLRLMKAAAPYTGGLAQDLNEIFTDKNRESAAQYDAEVQKLVADLREWENLLKLVGEDAGLAFKQDAGTANSIVGALTTMLQKLHEWEQSTTGQADLANVFSVHKEQTLALLKAFERLASSYGQFYMDVAPSVVRAVTDIADAFVKVADAIAKVPGGADVLGLGIVLAKLKLLNPILKETAKYLGIVAVDERAGGRGGGIGPGVTLGGGATTAAEEGAESTGVRDAETAGGGAAGGLLAGGLTKLKGIFSDGISSSVVAALKAATPELAAATLLEIESRFGPTNRQAALNAPRTASGFRMVNPRVAPGATPTGYAGLSAADAEQWAKDGREAAARFVEGMQAVKFPSTLAVFKSMQAQLDQLPPQARDAAARTMLEFAQTLQKEGKLPAGSVKTMIGALEGEFPALRSYLNAQGLGMESDLASHMKMTNAVRNTQSTVTQLKAEFGDLFSNATVTSGNMLTQVSNDFGKLKSAAAGQTGAMKTAASQNLTQLKQTAVSDATAMEQNVSSKMGAMSRSIQSGSAQALASATGDFKALANNVAVAIGSGALAAGKGSQLIGQALNQELKALGAKPIPSVALKSMSVSELLGEQHFITHGGPSNAGHGATAATGALLQVGRPGAGGGDNVPMNVGGTNIVVGEGEQVAVFNRHQQPIVNQALARMGYAGLPGLFGSVRTPNYMSAGGSMRGRGFTQGGSVWPGEESVVEKAGPVLLGAGFNDIGAAGVLGNAQQESSWNPSLPSGLWGFTSGDKSIAAWDAFAASHGASLSDVAAQAAFVLGTTPGSLKSAMNSSGSPGAAATLWMNDWEGPLVSSENQANREAGAVSAYEILTGKKIKGTAGGAGITTIGTPHVSGDGAIADMAQAMLGNAANAANAYLSKQQALAGPSTTGGGGTTFPFHFQGKLPIPVQKALEIANAIVADHPPYILGGYSPTGTGAAGYDCSGMVSSILHAAGLASGYMNTEGLESWGLPGRGRFITVGDVDRGSDSGEWPNNIHHTAVEIAGQYFESSYPGLGPHKDSGFPYPFPAWRHPPGLASGGVVGDWGRTRRPITSGSGSSLTSTQTMFAQMAKGKHRHAPKRKPPRPGNPHAQKPSTNLGAGTIGMFGTMPFNDKADLQGIDQMLQAIMDVAGGADGIPGTGNIQKLNNLLSYYADNDWQSSLYPSPNFSSYASPGDFVISNSGAGGATTYSISPHINQVAKQLSDATLWQGGIVEDLTQALSGSRKVEGPINTAIARRVREVKKIKARVEANGHRIKDLRRKANAYHKRRMENAKAQARERERLKGLLKQQAAEQKKKNPNQGTLRSLAAQIQGSNRRLIQLDRAGTADELQAYMIENRSIPALEKDNMQLAGGKDSVPSSAGGELGTIMGQLGASSSPSAIGLVEGSGSGASGLYGLLSQVQGWETSIGGVNGDLAQQDLTFKEYQGDLKALLPGAKSALATQLESNGSTSQITGTTAFTFEGQTFLASLMAQGGMVPKWAGSFMTGGTVPGAIGESQLAEVHGGEIIVNPNLPGAIQSGSSGAMGSLGVKLDRLGAKLDANTSAVHGNSRAHSSLTAYAGGMRRKHGSAYDPHTSSDVVANLGVGS